MKGVAIDVLLRTLLEPYGGALTVEGPSLWLPSERVAFPFSLAVNELATNAAKYGALMCDGGSLSVRWEADDDAGGFALEWTETCDRPVSEPAERGFGWQLIELMVIQRMGGTIDQAFESDGLRLRLNLPLTTPIAGQTVRADHVGLLGLAPAVAADPFVDPGEMAEIGIGRQVEGIGPVTDRASRGRRRWRSAGSGRRAPARSARPGSGGRIPGSP